MLNLQTSKTDSKEEHRALDGSKKRIEAMALIHELLYANDSFKEINMKEYIEQLVNGIARSYIIPGRTIYISIACEAISFNLDKAIPLGLIINEIVTNAFKYAFLKADSGEIKIILKQDNGQHKLTISDNGEGFPADFERRKEKSLGTELIQLLTEQLNGKLKVETSLGVSYSLLF